MPAVKFSTRRACFLALGMCAGVFTAFSQDLMAPNLGKVATQQLRTQADAAVNQQKWQEAYWFLQELSIRYKDVVDVNAVAQMEPVFYYLGFSAMMIGRHREAAAAYEDYMKRYPRSNRRRQIMESLGDVRYGARLYPEAAEVWLKIPKEFRVHPTEEAPLLAKVADAYFAIKDYAKGIPILHKLLKIAHTPELRSKAAVSLTQAHIANEDPGSIIELLPFLTSKNNPARYDAEFNIALVRGGDALLAEGDLGFALLLFQLALTKEELQQWYHDEEQRLLTLRASLIAQKKPGEAIFEVSEQMARIREKAAVLNDVKSYTEELRMRIARTYFDMGRKWEAMWTFWTVYKDFPKTAFSEQALYAAFGLASELDMRDRALELGKTFIEEFPQSPYWGEVVLNMGRLQLRTQNFALALELFNRVFNLKRDDKDAEYLDKVLYLTGYAYFQDEDLDNALKTFKRLRTEFPKSELKDAADYWVGMTYLFQKDYQSAKEEFSSFLTNHPESTFHEDAMFRRAVCLYGLLDFVEAKPVFESFITKYPDSLLRGEAHMFLGDIAAADGLVDEAVIQYQNVPRRTDNMTHVDYSIMQIGKLYEQLGEFQKMDELFSQYLREYGTRGNYTEAIYRQGFAKRSKGDGDGALKIYQDAIMQYVNDPAAIGVDFIIADWPQEYKSAKGVFPGEIILAEVGKARESKLRTAELRWRWAADLIGSPVEDGFATQPADYDIASPGSLVWMAKINKDKKPAESYKANLTVLKKFGTTEWIREPLKNLAEAEAKEKKYDRALKYLKILQEKFATEMDAAWATKREGDFLRESGNFKDAIAIYEGILQNKDWRGAIWPEAIYWIGECLYAQKEYQKAFAYFQRLYVLYLGYPEWAAKGYLMSGQCLEKLNDRNQTVTTYQEMLGNKDLESYPEYAQAKKRLEEIK